MHQTEHLCGVTATGAGLLERQALGVAGRRGHRDRYAGGDQLPTAEEAENAAAPMAWLAAGSEVVALARRAAAAGEGRWTADDADPEASFAVLVTAAAVGKGSGWLEWEPHNEAGPVRADPVVMLTAHRHFPVIDDEPWVHAAVGGAPSRSLCGS